jgi:mannose-6-phosphate isomerase
MNEIAYLRNRIQPYPWGSRTAFRDVLGLDNPDGNPQAELWLGAHPKAPSLVMAGDGWAPLDELIERSPDEILGPRAAAAFHRRLPFLFKVLAAAEPLSIQAHPDLRLAAEGFERENRGGVPLESPQRNYRDASHKPECMCALTPFWVMCGFRPPEEVLRLLNMLCPRGLGGELKQFKKQTDGYGLKRLFTDLLSLGAARIRAVVGEALGHLPAHAEDTLAWVPLLARRYPEDVGALAPALLNVLRLEPGEALFLPAGVLHSYLEGTGIEIMANSDNVVRGGLTTKCVDVPELLRILKFDSDGIQLVESSHLNSFETVYHTPAKEFQLSVIRLHGKEVYRSGDLRSVEILLCTDGAAAIAGASSGGAWMPLGRGSSVLVPAAAAAYRLRGAGTVYKATVPAEGGAA